MDWWSVPTWLNTISVVLSFRDRFAPDKQLRQLEAIRGSLMDMATQQRVIEREHAAVTTEQTRTIAAGLSRLILKQETTGQLVVAAIDSQTQALMDEVRRFASQQEIQTAMLGTATLEQTNAIVAQTARQIEGLAKISSGMDSTSRTLESIATELKVLSKPDLFNHIMGAGLLLTNAAAVAQIKRLADETARVADGLDRLADNAYSVNSRGDRFPGHVHSFVRSMIEKHQEEPTPHYFFLFNQSTTWHPEFDDFNRADPLGSQFLGYYHDLDVLVDFILLTA